MNRLIRQLTRLERKRPSKDRPVVVPFPIDGLTDEEITEGLAQWREGGDMTPEEWEAAFCADR